MNINSFQKSIEKNFSGRCPILNDEYSIKLNYIIFPRQINGKYIYMKPTKFECLIKTEDHDCKRQSSECPVFESAPSRISANEI